MKQDKKDIGEFEFGQVTLIDIYMKKKNETIDDQNRFDNDSKRLEYEQRIQTLLKTCQPNSLKYFIYFNLKQHLNMDYLKR
jgi:hypothetical protein